MKKTLLMLALVAGITSFAQNAQAELISIDIGSSPGFNIGGINGGVSDEDDAAISGFPFFGNTLFLYNSDTSDTSRGLSGGEGLLFATTRRAATPVNFSQGTTIGSGSTYASGAFSVFRYYDNGGSTWYVSPDFGAGSYMGFKTSQGNYGWLEVTWTASSDQFQIRSGAYEDQVGVAILAGGAAPIPEPGTWAAMAIFAGGAAYSGWRRRKSAKVSE